MSMSITDLVQKFADLRALRQKREGVVKQMKELEEKMQGMILNHLAVNGMKTINFDGIGQVTATSRDHAEFFDYELTARFIYRMMQEAEKNSTPLADALNIIQKRAATGTAKELLEAGFTEEELGIKIAEKANVTFKKA